MDKEQLKYLRRVVKNQLLLTLYSFGLDSERREALVEAMMQAFDSFFEEDFPLNFGTTD